ncbi:MAG: hypothetical protein HKN85_07390 [Gammaproteobacteria bacterium]|nr:hypothetical protein [Gammaproteobacteria bacterium]
MKNDPSILIVEDDVDQLDMLVHFVSSEVKAILNDEEIPKHQREKLKTFNIMKVSEMKSLQQAVEFTNNVIVTLLDCNIPDRKGIAPEDQFKKDDKQLITGQHHAVDLIAQHLPDTPITLISSMRRFQKTITRFYESNSDLKLKFISKDDGTKIREDVRNHLLKYVEDNS